MIPEERILAVFERRSIDRVPWNIRPEFWYIVNKARGTLPEKYRGVDIVDICREWGASWRCYSGYFVDSFVKVAYNGDLRFITREKGRLTITEIETPAGTVRETRLRDEEGFSSRIIEYPLKELKDIKPIVYMLEHLHVKFDHEVYERMRRHLGGHGILSYFFPRTPFQRLMINLAGVERTIKLVFRYPSEMEGLMEEIKMANDQFYEVMASTPIKIFNLGENIDVRMTSPKLFEKYCLPYYQERGDYLHKHGKFVHIHVDGWAKPLLPLLKETGLDGVEAFTVKPVGDMTLGDIKRALGDEMILIDGIPFIYFLPDIISLEKFDRFVKKIISMFSDNLILGISDELPPPADENRVKRVSRIIDELYK